MIRLLIGALLGAFAALWFTPKRGQEWRDELKSKGGKLRDSAENLGTKVPTSASVPNAELFETIKEKGAEFAGEAAGHFRDMKESAAQKIGEVKQEASGKARVVSADVSDTANETKEANEK